MAERSKWRRLVLALSILAIAIVAWPLPWLTRRQIVGRPKARFFGFLSVVWLFVSAPSAMQVWIDCGQRFTATDLLLVALVVLHPVFVALAIVFRLTEQPRTFTRWYFE